MSAVISGVYINLDLERYISGRLTRTRSSGDWILACCPYHDDRTPSFSVNTRTGRFKCFGCGVSGVFSELYQRLEGFDTVFDAERYLIATHGRFEHHTTETLEITLDEPEARSAIYSIDEGVLGEYRYRHPYLAKRGIDESVQRTFEIGYCRRSDAITIPWRDEAGRLIAVKKRSVASKRFWYEPALPPGVKSRVWYGLWTCIKRHASLVAITEAEIDCLSLWCAGTPAIAIGGNQPSQTQFDALCRTLTEDTEILVFTDNDAGGESAKEALLKTLSQRYKTSYVDWRLAPHAKDANDLSVGERVKLVEKRITSGLWGLSEWLS